MNAGLSNELAGWVPWKLSGVACEWLYTADKDFTEPFFGDTVSACKKLEENSTAYKVVSDLDILTEWASRINSVPPAAAIFHVSRCGSTLLSQLLDLDESHLVLSEVPFFDELLRLPFTAPATRKKDIHDYVSAAIKLYGQKRNGGEKHLFIKTDSWHLHFYHQLRSVLPGIPFILLYRNPLEVIRSHKKQRGMQSVQGLIEPGVFGFSKDQVHEPDPDRYMASVLKGFFKVMVDISKNDSLALPLNYAEGAASLLKKIYSFTGLHLTMEAEGLWQQRMRFHAKYPNQLFKEEQPALSIQPYLEPVLRLYDELDDIRLSREDILLAGARVSAGDKS